MTYRSANGNIMGIPGPNMKAMRRTLPSLNKLVSKNHGIPSSELKYCHMVFAGELKHLRLKTIYNAFFVGVAEQTSFIGTKHNIIIL